MEMTGTEIA